MHSDVRANSIFREVGYKPSEKEDIRMTLRVSGLRKFKYKIALS